MAGAILLKGNVLRGLTTAGSIWAVAALGLAAGGGLTFPAVAATVIILVILPGTRPLEDVYRISLQPCTVHIRAEHDAVTLAGIQDRAARLRTRSGIRSTTVKRGRAQPGWTDTSSTSTKGEHR